MRRRQGPIRSIAVGEGHALNRVRWDSEGRKVAVGGADGALYIFDVGEVRVHCVCICVSRRGPGLNERRARLPVRMRACCRTRSGFRDDVVITDLSTGGCRIESRSTTLRPGDLVLVRPEGLEGQPGVVCWVERNCVGIKFERPLYGPVVEHICQKHTMM